MQLLKYIYETKLKSEWISCKLGLVCTNQTSFIIFYYVLDIVISLNVNFSTQFFHHFMSKSAAVSH